MLRIGGSSQKKCEAGTTALDIVAVQEIEIADVHTVVMIVAGMGIVSVIAVMTEAIADPEIEIDAEGMYESNSNDYYSNYYSNRL